MSTARLTVLGLTIVLSITLLAPALADAPVAPLRDDDFETHSLAKRMLGRSLFYDPVLSGSYRVSCASCHNHDRASSNGFPLQAQADYEPDRAALPDISRYQRLKPSARHAPVLFNLGHQSFTHMFSDGRVFIDAKGRLVTPVGDNLPPSLDSVLAAQALFPAVTADELVGTVESGLTAEARAALDQGSRSNSAASQSLAIWTALAKRVDALEVYRTLFDAAYPDRTGPVTITQIANAIGAFVSTEWRADRSPFDTFLRGDSGALSSAAKRGEALFRGKAGCADCHAGALQSDQQFYAVATPLWPHTITADAEPERLDDVLIGRQNATGQDKDRFRFKTPSLRNVARTAPYGHAGSHKTLDGFLRGHLDPEAALNSFVEEKFGYTPPAQVARLVSQLLERNQLAPVRLDTQDFSDLLAFLETLTDPDSLAGRLGKPEDVPSNLAIE
ncbi:MAG: cytochrome c peroxidase [Pseudomonadota bacterium]